jgi:VanZ family protein
MSLRRVVPWAAVLAWAGLIFAVSAVPAADMPPQPGPTSYVAHFAEYAVFGALWLAALRTTRLPRGWAIALALTLASLYGASDEFHQWFVPGRASDPRDWVADTLGAALGVAASALWAKRRDQPR